jgi:chitinase
MAATPAAAASVGNPTISVAGVAVTEGNSGQTSMPFTVSLATVSSIPATARFRTIPVHSTPQPGDATPGTSCSAGVDFISVDQAVTIPANTNPPQVTVNVPICGDTLIEGGEIVAVQLSAVQGAVCQELCATWATIEDDDDLPGLSVGNASQTEGSSAFTALQHHIAFPVTLSAVSNETVSVSYATAPINVVTKQQAFQAAVGGASCGGNTDYISTSGTLSFSPGETSRTVSVAICGDTTSELNENFRLILSNPVNAAMTDSIGLGTIVDDD